MELCLLSSKKTCLSGVFHVTSCSSTKCPCPGPYCPAVPMFLPTPSHIFQVRAHSRPYPVPISIISFSRCFPKYPDDVGIRLLETSATFYQTTISVFNDASPYNLVKLHDVKPTFEVVSTLLLRIQVSCDVTPCRLVIAVRRFRLEVLKQSEKNRPSWNINT